MGVIYIDDNKGWISVYRNIQDCWIWKETPFSKGQAWIDLLLLTNHEDKKILFDGELITVERGQRITSIRQLADRWGWSRDKVSNFLNLLESDGMLRQTRDKKRTHIVIENYSKYQDVSASKKPVKSQSKASEKPVADTNNNYKQLITINNKYIVEIIDYLNSKLGSKYKADTDKTKQLILAKLNNGYSLEDFKTVIDKKYNEWNNTDMAKYLRPETLFGNKFEGYLNQQIEEKPKDKPTSNKPNKFHNFEQREYGNLEEIGKKNLENKLKKLMR